MRNFYYIQSYNLSHPVVRRMFDKLKLNVLHDSLVDLKVRSKLFIGFYEATNHAHEDFDKKLTSMYPTVDGEVREESVKVITVMNPKFAMSPDVAEKIAEKFGEQHNKWDDDCCGTVFFCEAPDEEDEDEFPSRWMLKYEIHFADDNIELLQKNGDYAFDPCDMPSSSYTSAYH